jgi:pSer/pThr/pTyr-binding forkhead associated (FHA) protein
MNDNLQGTSDVVSGWSLRANHSALTGKVYCIDKETLLGRGDECDLKFPAAFLSRKHAQLTVVNGQLLVKDLDSANGTFVNGQRVSEAKLKAGDELRFDKLSFTVAHSGGDIDKTSVRSAITIPSAPKPAPEKSQAAAKHSAAQTSAQASAPQEKRKIVGVTTLHRAINANEVAMQNAEKSAMPFRTRWLLLILGVILAAAAFFVFFE